LVEAVAGVAGVFIALMALGYAIYEGKVARDQAVEERRKQFDLSLLAEISRQWALTHTYQHVAGHIRALVRDSEELPLMRLGAGVGPPGEGQRLMRQLESALEPVGDPGGLAKQDLIRRAVQDRIDLELADAISSRLA
jgi:hypothetical protein